MGGRAGMEMGRGLAWVLLSAPEYARDVVAISDHQACLVR